MFWAIDYGCLAIIVSCALLVVSMRNLNGCVMALSAMGTMMSLLFVILGAPDDAHSEIVVGAIALPTMYLLAIGRLRASVHDRSNMGEEAEQDGAS